MAYLKSIFAALKLLFTLWQELKRVLSDSRKKAAEEKSQRHDDAIEKAKKAKTPEEAFDAQTDIVNNKP